MTEILPDNEHVLLCRIAENDGEAFAVVFHHYRNKIYSYGLKMLQSEEVAKEITQDVFMKLWMARKSLPQVVSLDAWLFTIARNHCFNLLKKAANERKTGMVLSAKTTPLDDTTQQTIYFNEYRRLLQKAVAALPPRQREVYILSYEKGLKREEIAHQLNISPETVKSQLALAIRFIRNNMGDATHAAILLILLAEYH